jgi:hypothetical protein
MKRLPSSALVAFLVAALARGPAVAAPLSLVPSVVPAAEDGPKLVVVTVGLDPKTKGKLGALGAAAEDAVERAGRFSLVPASLAFDPNVVKGQEAALQDARGRIKDGQKALDDLDNQKATEAFVAALAAFRKTDLTKTWSEFLSAWVLKAASHATGGENPQAKAEIEKIVAVDAKADFPSQFFPPELLKYADTQRKLSQGAKGELTVRTEPPGARVWIDGTWRGTSPVTVESLMGGKHFVIASLGGYATLLDELTPGEEVLRLSPGELAPQLARTVDAVAKDPEGPGRVTAAKSLGKALGVDQVLLVMAKKSPAGDQHELTAVRVDVKDGHEPGYRQITAPLSDADAIAAFLDGVLAKDEPRKGGPVAHFKAAPGALDQRTLLGYSLAGAGVVLLASGVIFGVNAQNNATAYRGTLQVETTKAQDLASRGRIYSVTADVSWVLGLGAAAAGGILAFTKIGEAGAAGGDQDEVKAKKPSDEPAKKKKKKKAAEDEAAAEEKAKEDEAAAEKKKSEAKKAKEDADRKAEEEKKAKEEEEKAAEAKKKAEEEESKPKKKKSKKEKAEEERRQKEEEAKAEEEKKKAEEEKKKAAEEQKKADEAAAKKKAEDEAKKKKKHDEDDLRDQ